MKKQWESGNGKRAAGVKGYSVTYAGKTDSPAWNVADRIVFDFLQLPISQQGDMIRHL